MAYGVTTNSFSAILILTINYLGINMCNSRTALIVSGCIFILVSCVHVLRLIYHWSIIVNGTAIPGYASIFGIIVSLVLAIWMFSAAFCIRR